MSAIADNPGCGFGSDELLPARAGESGPSEAASRHLAGCPACARTLAQRQQLAAELRALPRLAAPRGPASALQIAAILDRLDESRLEARLASEAGTIRRWLAALARLRAPETLVAPLPALQPARRLVVVRGAALAAAAALVAAASILPWLGARSARSGAPGAHGLAAQTAALCDRTPIQLRAIERVDSLAAGPRPIELALPPAAPARRGGP